MDFEEDCVIFFGPPHAGKTLFYHEKLKSTHERLTPDSEFKTAEVSFRQLIMQKVINPIKEGKKVVIDDENWSSSKRESYTYLIQKKNPNTRCCCLKFEPELGRDQLLWQREWQLAERALGLYPDAGDSSFRISDAKIETWCTGTPYSSAVGTAEQPELREGFSALKTAKTILRTQSHFKFEVPCLFLQWEAVGPEREGAVKLATGCAAAIQTWYKTNPCGRVIIIHDGHHGHAVSDNDVRNNIRSILKELTSKLKDCVVYLVHRESASQSGGFSQPSSPGLLVFMQRLHHLDLQHKATMYLYQTPVHMRMAEKSGVQHIKASRVFGHTKLASSSHAAVKPTVPEILRRMQIVPSSDVKSRDHTPQIPLFKEVAESESSVTCKDVGAGRVLYVAAKDQSVLTKYQDLYTQNATTVSNRSESKIARLSRQLSQSVPTLTQPSQATMTTANLQSARDLPRWMMPSQKKQPAAALGTSKHDTSLSAEHGTLADSSNISRGGQKGSSAVYIMSQAELVDTATAILNEIGKPIPPEQTITSLAELMTRIEGHRGQVADVQQQQEPSVEQPVPQPASDHERSASDDDLAELLGIDHWSGKQTRRKRKITQESSEEANDTVILQESPEQGRVLLPSTESFVFVGKKPGKCSFDSNIDKSCSKESSNKSTSTASKNSSTSSRPFVPSSIASPVVKDTESEEMKEKSAERTKKPSIILQESFVEDTVTTIPETVLSRQNSAQNNPGPSKSKFSRTSKEKDVFDELLQELLD